MRSAEELIAEHERYLTSLEGRFGSVWPSSTGFSSAPQRTFGSFGLFEYEGSLWIEPLPGSEPLRADLLAALADEVWNWDHDPYLWWWEERFPSVGHIVDSVRAYTSGGVEANSSFLYAVDEPGFRPVDGDVEVRRATREDDLLLLSKVLSVAESYPQPVKDMSLGVRALPGHPGDPKLRQAVEESDLVVFFAVSDAHPVAVGFHRPVEGATEIRIGCLPESRRAGFGGAVLEALVHDAFDREVETVFVFRDVDDPRSLFGFSMVAELIGVEFLHLGLLTAEQREVLRTA